MFIDIHIYWKIKNYDFKIWFIFYSHHHVINKVSTLSGTIYNCVNSNWIIAEQILSFLFILNFNLFFKFQFALLPQFSPTPFILPLSPLTSPPLIYFFQWGRVPMECQQSLTHCGTVPSPSPCIKFCHGIQL